MSEPTPEPQTRRSLLCAALGAGAAAVGAALLAPPLVVLVAPLVDTPSTPDATSATRWVDVGPASLFPVGTSPRRVILRAERRDAWRVEPGVALGTIWVQRPHPSSFLIHSAACTHLGCAVDFRDALFVCPCHGARFSPDGALAPLPDGAPNPAPRPLDALEWRLNGGDTPSGRLLVAWRRFEPNIPEQRPVGGGAA
jgi:Rieske Fe-S protein